MASGKRIGLREVRALTPGGSYGTVRLPDSARGDSAIALPTS